MKTVSSAEQRMLKDKNPSIFFSPKLWRHYCVYMYPSNIFLNTCSFENWEISLANHTVLAWFRLIAREQIYLDYNCHYLSNIGDSYCTC